MRRQLRAQGEAYHHLQQLKVEQQPTYDQVIALCRTGQLDKALLLLPCISYNDQQQQKVDPPHHHDLVYLCLLKACCQHKALPQLRQVQAHLACRSHDLSDPVGAHLVLALSKCGDLENAQAVFSSLPCRTVFSWTALMNGYMESGQGAKALDLYQRMQNDGVEPNAHTFVSLFKACASTYNLQEAEILRGEAQRRGFASGVYLGSTLLSMYIKCGHITEAEDVFNELIERNLVSWNALLTGYVEQSRVVEALHLYRQMLEEIVAPDQQTFTMVLKACGILASRADHLIEVGRGSDMIAFKIGQALHAEARRNSFMSDSFVGNTLLSMYGKCGAIVDAEHVFVNLPLCDGMSWNAMLSMYVDHYQVEKTLRFFIQMHKEGVSFNEQTFVAVLQACGALLGKVPNWMPLEVIKALHVDSNRKGFTSDTFVCNTLLSVYAKYGNLAAAINLFHNMSHRDDVSWSVMISAYVQQDHGEKAFHLYRQMLQERVSPNLHAFMIACKECSKVGRKEAFSVKKAQLLEIGHALHAGVRRDNFTLYDSFGKSLINMYCSCGSLSEAENVYNELSWHDAISCSAMLSAYIQEGEGVLALQLYDQMLHEGVDFDSQVFALVLQACGILAEMGIAAVDESHPMKAIPWEIGLALHADAQKRGYTCNNLVGSSLVSMYAKCRSIKEAEFIFCELAESSTLVWSAMLSAYVEHNQAVKAMCLYRQMLEEGVNIELHVFSITLRAFGTILERGKLLMEEKQPNKVLLFELVRTFHADARRLSFASDCYVSCGLISLYGECGSMHDAESVFAGMSNHDIVSWLVLLSVYVEQGHGEKALQFYRQMQVEGLVADNKILVSTLKACGTGTESMLEDGPLSEDSFLEIGKALHVDVEKKGFATDILIGNTLISMYSKCRRIVEAEDVFAGLAKRDVVSWNAMLSAYVEEGQEDDGLRLYRQMKEEGVSPNVQTFRIILQACAGLADMEEAFGMEGRRTKVKSLEVGRGFHLDSWRKGFHADVFVNNTLLSVYGRCGSIGEAEELFGAMHEHDAVTWSVMISAYVEEGYGEKALELFRHMQKERVTLDDVTIISVLKACIGTGSLEVCRELHFIFLCVVCEPNLAMANTFIRAYGSCACMDDAQVIFDELSKPGVTSWNACIAGYTQEGNCLASLIMFKDMQTSGVMPNEVTFLSLLCVCSHASLVNEGIQFFNLLIRDYGLTPNSKHYVIMIDLLGRAGNFSQVEDLLAKMAMEADLNTWLCLLSVCRTHSNANLGKQAFHNVIRLKPKDAAAYILMSNIYVDAGLQDCADDVKNLRQREDGWKDQLD